MVRPVHVRATLCALLLGLVGSLLVAPTSAHAAFTAIRFDSAKTAFGMEFRVETPRSIGNGRYASSVEYCNLSGSTTYLAPYDFSYTVANNQSWTFPTRLNTLQEGNLANGYCAEFELVAPEYFQQVNIRLDSYDLVVANSGTTLSVGTPRSQEGSGYYGDQTGDKRADVVGLAHGRELVAYRTLDDGRLTTLGVMDPTASDVTWVGKIGDLDKSGYTDLAIRYSSGNLWTTEVAGPGKLGWEHKVSTGWHSLSMLTVVTDVNNDGRNEIIGRDSSNRLLIYEVTANSVTGPRVIGWNWGNIRQLLSVGDFSGDGIPDLLAIDKGGVRFRYTFNSSGKISSKLQVGHGWNSMTQAFSPGDMNRDGRRDMLGVHADGRLFLYRNLGNARWGTKQQVGHGWNSVTVMA